MRVGIVLPIGQEDGMAAPPTYPEIRAVALEAEGSGLDSVWVYDHLLFRFDGETTGIHECWTILAAVAEATSRVELGTIVMCTGFRNPALLAKMAATLDHLSGGRLILGVGCGWHDPEYEAFGYPTDHKVGRFEEALTVIRGLIRDGRADLDGRWVSATDAVLIPPARPDLPILIAAKRPRMLELTARHADAWNLAWFGAPDARLAAARADLAAACGRVGRDPATLEITVGITVRFPDLVPPGEAAAAAESDPAISGTVEDVAAGLAAHEVEGAAHLIVTLEPRTPESVRRLGSAVALLRDQRMAAAKVETSGS
jgi:alkanesulfonate monooxygenase SsuD/methylene tetrahydromethanopterin reductase-like flavin-dependent oxidoreductase (luciferase family)